MRNNIRKGPSRIKKDAQRNENKLRAYRRKYSLLKKDFNQLKKYARHTDDCRFYTNYFTILTMLQNSVPEKEYKEIEGKLKSIEGTCNCGLSQLMEK